MVTIQAAILAAGITLMSGAVFGWLLGRKTLKKAGRKIDQSKTHLLHAYDKRTLAIQTELAEMRKLVVEYEPAEGYVGS